MYQDTPGEIPLARRVRFGSGTCPYRLSLTNGEPVPRCVEDERAGTEPDEPEEKSRVHRQIGKEKPAHCVECDREDDPEADIENDPAAIHSCKHIMFGGVIREAFSPGSPTALSPENV